MHGVSFDRRLCYVKIRQISSYNLSKMIHQERLELLNDRPISAAGDKVIYWMQQAKRESCNHALEYAVERANELAKPLLVVFVLVENFPEANFRHFLFLTEGLPELQKDLQQRGIGFEVIKIKQFTDLAEELMKLTPALLVMDKGYLLEQRKWQEEVLQRMQMRVWRVESDILVPVAVTSNKAEFAARTIRPKIRQHWRRFLQPLARRKVQVRYSQTLNTSPVFVLQPDLSAPKQLAATLASPQVISAGDLRGGYREAKKLLAEFLTAKLANYAQMRNHPEVDFTSNLSPYLHHGQISVLEIALATETVLAQYPDWQESAGAFLEELIVRRELAINFCFYNTGYMQYERAIPAWARNTLQKHASDPRPAQYSLEQLEAGLTADPIWNAAQIQMVRTGKMHGYMRMYWGKKVLEWTAIPQHAFEILLYLNNKYELDGFDANGYVGVAWCFGLHDRPWQERPIFGLVRYMNDNGIKRKISAWSEYVKKYS